MFNIVYLFWNYNKKEQSLCHHPLRKCREYICRINLCANWKGYTYEQVSVVYYLIGDLERIVDVSRWFWKRLSTILKRLKRLTLLKSSTVSILCSLYSDFKDFDWFASEIFPKTEIAVAIIPQSTHRKLYKANRNDFSTISKRLSRVKCDVSLKTVRALPDVLWPYPLTKKTSLQKISSTLLLSIEIGIFLVSYSPSLKSRYPFTVYQFCDLAFWLQNQKFNTWHISCCLVRLYQTM